MWNEPTLVSFLIVFLLYATYQPLRFAIEDPERQARYASVFAITAGAFVPLNFIAVRLSTAYLHPRVLGSTSNLPGPMALTFLVSLVGDGAAVRDALQVRADRQARPRPAARAAAARWRAKPSARPPPRSAAAAAPTPARERGAEARLMSALLVPSCPRCRCTRPASTSPAPTSCCSRSC